MSIWLEKVFLQVLNMSLMGICCVAAVLLVRFFIRKQPKIFSYVLWSIVLFRLVCPISFESPFSAFRMTNQQVMTSRGIETVNSVEEMGRWWENDDGTDAGTESNAEAIEANGTATNNIVTNEITEDSAVTQNMEQSEIISDSEKSNIDRKKIEFWQKAEVIWLAGSSLMLIYAIGSAVLLKKKLKSAEKREGYYESAGLETPFVFGIFPPKIYLPAGLSEKEMCYILEHEHIHIRRRDYLIKLIAFLVLCIHWFNPFVWLAFFCMERDMEMSCDEAVIKKMGKEIKQEYSTSLLNLACGRRFLNGSPIAFGEGEVKGRVKNILNYKKPGFWGVSIGIVVIVITAIVLISNPETSESEQVKNEKITTNISGETIEKTTAKVSDDRLPILGKVNEEQLKELLSSYEAEQFEDLLANQKEWKYWEDMIFIGPDKSLNVERWMEFYHQTKEGKEDAVLIATSCVDDRVRFTYLSGQEENYYMLVDSTRLEGEEGQNYSDYESMQMPALKEITDWGAVAYYLVDSKERTREEIESNLWDSEPVEVYPIFSFEYEGLEEILGSEEIARMRQSDLEVNTRNAILEANAVDNYLGEFQTESHETIWKEEKAGETTVYALVLYQDYNASGEKENESYAPVAITFTQKEDGTYQLKEYWTPEEGSDYKSSVEEKFPESIWEQALDETYVEALEKECNEKAVQYFAEKQ